MIDKKLKFTQDLNDLCSSLKRYSSQCDKNDPDDLNDLEFFCKAKIFTDSLSDNIITKILANKDEATKFYQNVKSGKDNLNISPYLSISFDALRLTDFCKDYKDEIESALNINKESSNFYLR